jgi:hypothetical protein
MRSMTLLGARSFPVVLLLSGLFGCGESPPEPGASVIDAGRNERPREPSPTAPPPPRREAPAVDAAVDAAAADPSRETDLGTDALLRHLAEARAVRARPISKRSLSLKLTLKDGRDAAFKPLLRGNRSARHEVAAFRVSELLGSNAVPPSIMRRIPLDNFEWMLGEEHAEVNDALREQAHLDERSGVWGAAIVWIDGLGPSGLDEPKGLARLRELVALDGPSLDREPLAADASAMVVFDYVIGNWDRFSGGNLFLAPSSDRLVLLDNNGAFSRWSENKQQRMDELLGFVHRFSRRLIESLRALTRDRVERALAEDPWHRTRRLLTERERELLLARRDEVLARVDALVAEHGAGRVLAFP